MKAETKLSRRQREIVDRAKAAAEIVAEFKKQLEILEKSFKTIAENPPEEKAEKPEPGRISFSDKNIRMPMIRTGELSLQLLSEAQLISSLYDRFYLFHKN